MPSRGVFQFALLGQVLKSLKAEPSAISAPCTVVMVSVVNGASLHILRSLASGTVHTGAHSSALKSNHFLSVSGTRTRFSQLTSTPKLQYTLLHCTALHCTRLSIHSPDHRWHATPPILTEYYTVKYTRPILQLRPNRTRHPCPTPDSSGQKRRYRVGRYCCCTILS